MNRNVRPVRDCSVKFSGSWGARRFPRMVNANLGGNYLHLKSGVGKIQAAGEIAFGRMINGQDVGKIGMIGELGATNALLSTEDLSDVAKWTATTLTVSAATFADMYGGMGAQKLTPTAVTSKLRQQTQTPATGVDGRKCMMAIDLRADVEHTARLLLDNNKLTTEQVDVTVTTTWKRFYLNKYFPAATGAVLCVEIYPDITAGAAVVYARAPFANTPFYEIFTATSPSGPKNEDVLTFNGVSMIRGNRGTVAVILCPGYDVKLLTVGNYSLPLFDFDVQGGGLSAGFQLLVNANTDNLHTEMDDGTNFNSVDYSMDTLNMQRGTFYLLASTWDETEIRLYANGALLGSDNSFALNLPGQGLCAIQISQWAGLMRAIIYRPFKTDDSFHLKLYNDLKRSGEVV